MSVAKNRLKTVLLYFFLLQVLLLPAASRSENADSTASPGSQRQRVLVLHSYHHGFTWSDNISMGIRSAFDERGSDAELIFEFMDTRRIHTEEYFTQLHDLFKVKYLNRKIDVLICADDHSLNFVLNQCGDICPDVPIVFCSVSGFRSAMRKGRQITGLIESIDIKSTLDAALMLHPGTREVAVITDMTRTGKALKKKAENIFRGYASRLKFIYLEDMTVEELHEQVSRLPDRSIVFLFIFARDSAGRVLLFEENLRGLVRHSKIPI
jgi:phosphoserine phosphatase RsbU/P